MEYCCAIMARVAHGWPDTLLAYACIKEKTQTGEIGRKWLRTNRLRHNNIEFGYAFYAS